SDYHDQNITVRPAADPHIVSDTQRLDNAKLLASNSLQVPGHNRYQAFKHLYEVMQIPEIDRFLPPPMTQGPDGKPQPAQDFPAAPDPKMLQVQVKQGELQLKIQEFQSNAMEAKIRLQ